MSTDSKKEDNLKQDVTNHTNNFSYNNSINNFQVPNQPSQSIPNVSTSTQPKPAYPFTFMINPIILNNPNFKQLYPQFYQNMAQPNNSNPIDTNNPSTAANNSNIIS